MHWTVEEIEKVMQEINEKVTIDMEFRKLVLSDPYKAVEQISGKEVPKGFNIRFIDNEGYHITHVLPDLQSPIGEELTDDELEQVSAGYSDKIPGCARCGSKEIKHYYTQKVSFGYEITVACYRCNSCGYDSANDW